MNNNGSVAQLIERDGWRTQRDLVGHRKAVTCVRFNLNLLYQNKTTKKQTDTSSNKSGTSVPNAMTPSSSTGSSNNINNGNNNNNSNHNSAANFNGAPTKTTSKSTSLINKTVKYCCLAVGSRDRSISVWLTSQPRPLIVTHDLFESSVLDISWSRDGYRLLACSQDGTVAAMVFSPSELGHKLTSDEKQAHFQKLYGKSINSTPATTKTIIVEDPDLIKVQPETNQSQRQREVLDQQSSHSNSFSHNGFNGCESNTSMNGMSKGPTDRQIETLLPGGKRRITPLYIQPPLPFNSASNITFSSSKESKTKIMIETTTSSPSTPTPNNIPTTPVKTVNSLPTIRREHIVPKHNHKTLAHSKIDKATVFRIKDLEGKDLILEAENDTNFNKLNELRLMDDTNNKVWDVLLSSKINSVIATETFAAASCMDNSLHLFDLQSGRRLTPPLVLDSPVAHITAEKEHLLTITSNANMWLWDISRNRNLIKGESVSPILASSNNATTSNEKQAQNKSNKTSEKSSNAKGDELHNNQINNDKGDGDIEILSCSLTTNYQPLILLSTGKAFLFDHNLHCWMLMSDSNDSITRWSSCKPSLTAMKRFLSQQHAESLEEFNSMKKKLPLASLQSQHSFDIKRFASCINREGSESLQVKATRSYLDQQLASALAIKSSHEYHYWLIQSVQHYVDTGAEARLKDLCSRLISSAFGKSDDDSGRHENFIMGLSKLSLLKEVLSILSKDLRYQRIYSEYKQLLDYNEEILMR